MIEWLRSRVHFFARSDFVRNALWFTTLTAFDRVIAVVQTVLIARALGITEYGIYGLLFGTIGFVASVVGLQMGLTATVFVSKYRDSEKAKAAAVILIVDRFGWLVAAAVLLSAIPFNARISELLLGSGNYQVATLLGIIFVGATILSGVQDGIAQGFEIFVVLAKLKIATSVLVMASIYPMARNFGLDGVLCSILGGLILKLSILQMAVRRCRAEAAIPNVGAGVSFHSLVGNFAFPSMAVSLLLGFVTWLGLFMLSRQPAGFDGVAIVNTGLQWRSPLLLFASTIGTVAIPFFSRLAANGDEIKSSKLRNNLAFVSVAISVVAFFTIASVSNQLLSLYGPEFSEYRLSFLLILASSVPTILAQAYFQQWVGAARMWRVLILHCPYFLVTLACFVVLVPKYQSLGYAVSCMMGALALVACAIIGNSLDRAKSASKIVSL